MQIIVLGGGTGGLAISALLARQGKDVILVEKNNFVDDHGAGIQISSNAQKVLYELGIIDLFWKVADEPSQINIREIKSFKKLFTVPIAEFSNNVFNGRYHHVHRQDLIDLLLFRAKELGVTIFQNEKINRINETKEKVFLYSESGKLYEGNMLIAADGLNSVSRKYLFPDHQPKFQNLSAWRTCIKFDENIPDVFVDPNLFISKNLHLVTYPIRDNSILNCVLIAKDSSVRNESWKQAASFSDIAPLLNNTNQAVKKIFLQNKEINKWGLFEHKLKKWYSKRIVMIGDAAHPMLPFMSQGASASLEDSYALSVFLENFVNLPDTFSKFQRFRYERVEEIQKISSRNRYAFHQSTFLRKFIFTILRLMPSILIHRLKRVYNYDIVSQIKN